MSNPVPGARSSRRRVDLDLPSVLAIVLPLLTVAALLLVRQHAPVEETGAPTRTALTRASIVCPSALPGAPTAYLSTAGKGAEGSVEVRTGPDAGTVRISADQVSAVDRGRGPLTVTGEDDLAPALVGARFGAGKLAAVSCSATAPDQWFTAVGAGAKHNSVLELVNPDAGPAIADVTVYGGVGRIDVPRLRGVSVPGRSSVRLDLGSVTPRRGELALHVLTSRGRLAASVSDTYDELGAGQSSQDWLGAQPAPSTRNVLMGLAPGEGTRSLSIANGGADEVRVSVKVISEDSVFAPEGVEEIRVAPDSVHRVTLTGSLLSAIRKGAVGLEVTSTAPVTATLRSFAEGDLSHAVSGTPVSSGARVVVPQGPKQVVLAGAEAAGVVTVVAFSESGERLASMRAEVGPGRGTVVKLPEKAVLVAVTPERTPVTGAVLVSGNGAAVVPLTELVRNGLIPAMSPGLP